MNTLPRQDAPQLAYRVEGSGPPLVLVHGVGGDSTSWDGIVPALAPRFRVIRLDLRGHGRSAPIQGDMKLDDFVRDVIDVMDAEGVPACRLAGFSLGGLIAQAVALAHPARVEKLALISTPGARTQEERASGKARAMALEGKQLADVAAGLRERWFTDEFQRLHPEKVEARVQQLLRSDPASYMRSFAIYLTTDLGDRLHGIRAPTLIVTGEHDQGASPRMAMAMYSRMGNATVKILPGLRHSLLVEAPEQVSAVLQDFL